MKVIYCLLVVFTLFIPYIYGTNILGIFDMPSKSVHILGYELLVGLAKRGYNVTLMSAIPVEEQIANFSHLHFEGILEFKEKQLGHLLKQGSKFAVLTIFDFTTDLVKFIMENKSMKNLLNYDNKYDVIIQSYGMNEAFLGLADHFDARVIGFTPFSSIPNVVAVSGNSAPYSYVALPFLNLSQNMNLFERVTNTLACLFFSIMHRFYLLPKQAEILKANFPNAPPIEQIQNDRVDLFFSNAHFSNETPRPKTPNIIYIGGYHTKQPQELSLELKDYLDTATEGIIYLGFGTNIDLSTLPKEKVDIFLNKFSKISNKVLLKYEGIIENVSGNVRVSAWYPQRRVLAHSNTKIFISHGGKTSATESLYYGIPTLCISFLGDQKKNCEDIADYGYGIHLPFEQVTEETFEEAFDELMNNKKYAETATYRARLFQEQELDPLDRAIFWIEHILKYKGAKHLRPKSANMSLYQYLLLDVWLFIILSTLLLTYILHLLIKYLLKLLCTKKGQSQKKDKTKKL